MSVATITSKGRITIPKEIRARLDLHCGDKIYFIVDDQGKVSFIPATKSITSLQGIISKPGKSISIEDMTATVKSRGSGS